MPSLQGVGILKDTDDTTAGTATAGGAGTSFAAVVGRKYYITEIAGSFGASVTGLPTLTLKDDTTSIYVTVVTEREHISFNPPVEITTGKAANLELTTGGAGVVGTATLIGFSEG
jgi:hypothetical protein